MSSENGYTETEVRTTLTDRPVEEMTTAALHAEWSEAAESLVSGAIQDVEVREQYWDRRVDLWQEMASRVDADAPACPECGAQRWGQTAGDPKRCLGCGLELGARHEDLIEEINQFWATVKSVPEVADGE